MCTISIFVVNDHGKQIWNLKVKNKKTEVESAALANYTYSVWKSSHHWSSNTYSIIHLTLAVAVIFLNMYSVALPARGCKCYEKCYSNTYSTKQSAWEPLKNSSSAKIMISSECSTQWFMLSEDRWFAWGREVIKTWGPGKISKCIGGTNTSHSL